MENLEFRLLQLTLAENIIIIWLDKWESRLILNANLIFIQI